MTDGEGTGSTCTQRGRGTEAGSPRGSFPFSCRQQLSSNHSRMEADVAVKGQERACTRAGG